MSKTKKLVLGLLGLAVLVPAGWAGAAHLPRSPQLAGVVAQDTLVVTCAPGAATGSATGFFKSTRNVLGVDVDELFTASGANAVAVFLDGEEVVRLLKNETFYLNPSDFDFPCDDGGTFEFTFQPLNGNDPVGTSTTVSVDVDVVPPSS